MTKESTGADFKSATEHENKKLFIETYGCQMNVADSEVIASIMQMAGYSPCETLEEAGARVELGPMFTFVDLPHISQIHIIYRAKLLHLDFNPGEESLEAALVSEAEIPWNEIAFRSIDYTLKCFFEDRRRGKFDLHSTALSIPAPGTFR